MKADPAAQRRLLELRNVDVLLSRVRHKVRHLPQEARVRELTSRAADLKNVVVRANTEASDIGREIAKTEDEAARVRLRADRDRQIAGSGVGTKQQQDLHHELATLERRQRELDDAELELLQRQEDLSEVIAKRSEELKRVTAELEEATRGRDAERARLGADELDLNQRRAQVAAEIDVELMRAYDRSRAEGGAGAAEMSMDQCGGCQLQLAPVEAKRVRESAPDEVEFCEECGCILVR